MSQYKQRMDDVKGKNWNKLDLTLDMQIVVLASFHEIQINAGGRYWRYPSLRQITESRTFQVKKVEYCGYLEKMTYIEDLW